MQDAADETPTGDVDVQPYSGARWKRRIFGAVALLLVVLLAFTWTQRNSIADRFVQNAFAERGVKASYKIDTIGFRTQRIRDLVIGDPTRPDLTAKLVEIDVALNFSGAALRDVRAKDVMLRGRYVNDKLTFGELDKFRDPTSTEPFKWPDIAVDIKNARARIDTPWGVIGAGLNGSGLLRNRFSGNLALRSPGLKIADCNATDVSFDGKLLMEWREPRLIGPITSSRANCMRAGVGLVAPRLNADLKLSERFNAWSGDIGVAVPFVNVPKTQLKDVAGKLSVDGSLKRTNFALMLEKGNLRSAPLSVRQLQMNAKGYAGMADGRIALSVRGSASLNGGAFDRGTINGLGSIAAQTGNTPVGPIIARMAPVLENAGDQFTASLDFDAYQDFQSRRGASIGALAFTSASGVRVRQIGSFGITQASGGLQLNAPVGLALSGNNLPSATLTVAQSGRSWSGNLVVAPYAAGGARLAVSNLAFNGSPGQAWRFQGQAKLSGPMPGGFVTGLNLPIAGRYTAGTFALYDSCQNARFDALRVYSLALRGQSLRLCPDAGQSMLTLRNGNARFATNIAGFAAMGTLGSTRIAARSANIRFSLDEGFAARDVVVELGEPDVRTLLNMTTLAGSINQGGADGTLTGGAGQIGNVPLLLEQASGEWRYLDQILTLNARLNVLDAAQVDRFEPMVVPDMLLTLENNVISAIGHLVEPTTNTRVSDVDIRHDLSNSSGRALLAVDGLRFNDRFQPDLLTSLVLGVAANVDGVVSGDGRIDWDKAGVRSTGRVSTKGMNLAAAFGPVEGLTTEIVFSDLLGLETASGQIATVASVNPGIPALDGKISYKLLPNRQVAVESGRWPFAGGELILEPTVLDFGVESERRLTFRVIGVDAEKLLAGYDFQNLRVTGVFDGTLPMVFNQDGGRIVGGALVSRPGGGEVSYLGELAYKDMGVFANYAFNALRSIRYSTLTIGVGGDLDGEIVTDISFTGLQQGTLAKRNFITRQLARIPIKFNVSVTAEFLKLIGSIRGLYDANYAADRDLQYLLEEQKKQSDGTTPQAVETKKEPSNE
ncbi:YdbH domain-containing protein [Sphingorhabdus sp.]|uniref:intermembrane phospholipid transport protein YdbH family protein n=1 Tax=Sphingorhabdus sp. TaxID=1902408 RepID=UPI0039838405